MLDLSLPAPSDHPLADVWDCLQWLESNRAARRPPREFPQELWGAHPYLGSQAERFFYGPPDERMRQLWRAEPFERRLECARRLLSCGVRSAQLMPITGEKEVFFTGLLSGCGVVQKRGPISTVRQVFRRRPLASHANSFLDSFRKRICGAPRSFARVAYAFEKAYAEYLDVVDTPSEKLTGCAAWTVAYGFLCGHIEQRICLEVLQIYWAAKAHATRGSPFIVDPDLGVTAADRVRFYLQYYVVPSPR
jgi:hypothetical protein